MKSQSMPPVNAPRKPHGNEIALEKNATRYAWQAEYASINCDRINRESTSSKAQEGTSPSIHDPSSPPVAPLVKSDPQATPTPSPFSLTSSPLPAHAASTDPGPRGRVSARAPWTAYPCCRAADTAARYRFCTRIGPPTARRRRACADTTARGKR